MKLDDLIITAKGMSYYSGILHSLEFKEWKNKCERIIKSLDKDSFNKFVKLTFSYTGIMFVSSNIKNDYSEDYKRGFIRDINETIGILESLKDDEVMPMIEVCKNKNKIFIVHGHDEAEKEKVKHLIVQIGFEPIIIGETKSNGKVLIQTITDYINDVDYAIVLYTPCDMGGKDKDTLKNRARQNVVFEHGYLMAKLGTNNIFYLKKGDVEIPSDLQGMIYTDMDNAGAWKYILVDNMKNAGYDIDKNKI